MRTTNHKYSILLVCCFFTWMLNAQNTFVPDAKSMLISEFTLNNGETIRGRVIRMVPGQTYDVRTISQETIRIHESEVEKKVKAFVDLRESRYGYYLGLSAFSPLMPELQSFMPGLTLGNSYDFGKDLKYSFLGEISTGVSFSENNNLFQESIFVTAYTLAIGYKHNRAKKHSHAFYLGSMMLRTENIITLNATARFEYARKLGSRSQMVPFVSVNQSFWNLEGDFNPSFLSMGLLFKFYMPSNGIR